MLLVGMGMDTSDKDLQCFVNDIKLWVNYINIKWQHIYVDYVLRNIFKIEQN